VAKARVLEFSECRVYEITMMALPFVTLFIGLAFAWLWMETGLRRASATEKRGERRLLWRYLLVPIAGMYGRKPPYWV
jgi:hypothetical protein